MQTTQTRYTKLIKDLKEKVVELEADKAKVAGVVKNKDKAIEQGIRESKEEMETLKKELQKKESELKKAQEDIRNNNSRDKMKQDELEMENERMGGELAMATTLSNRNRMLVDHLEIEVKGYKESLKLLTRDKEDLARGKQEIEVINFELEELK